MQLPFQAKGGYIFNMVTLDTFKRGFKSGAKTLIDLSRIMVPVYIGVQLLSISGLLAIIANFFTPVMSFFGLPGETSLTLIVGYFSGVYAALGTLAAIKLTAVQATTIAIMVSIAHNLISESAVIKKLGVSAVACSVIRLIFSVVFGFLYYKIFG